MGMFDYVKAEISLPTIGVFAGEMQTKSLDCTLATYRIAADGRLWCDREGWHKWDQPAPEPQPHAYTGEIEFYPGRFADGDWPQFSAYFVRGELKELHRTDKENA